jgi:hypothetical protein
MPKMYCGSTSSDYLPGTGTGSAPRRAQGTDYVHVLVVFDDGLGDNTLQHSAAME